MPKKKNGSGKGSSYCRWPRRDVGGEELYAVDMVFPFVASLTDRSMGFEANGDLTQMIVQCTDIVTEILVHHREARWVEIALPRLRSETEGLKLVARRVFALHCTAG